MRRLAPDTAVDTSATRLAECLVHALDLSNVVLFSFPVVYKWAAMVFEAFSYQRAQVAIRSHRTWPGWTRPQAFAKL